jgi:hypothetical protein
VRHEEERIKELMLTAHPPPAAEAAPDWLDVTRRAHCAAAPNRERRLRLPTRRLSPVATGLSVAAATIVGVTVVVGLVTIAAPKPFVERALAAVPSGPVLHATLETPVREVVKAGGDTSFTIVDLESRIAQDAMYRIELWYDRERNEVRQRQAIEDAVQWDSVEAGDVGGAPAIDQALATAFIGYEQALRDESGQITGNGVVGGRSVRWLRFQPRAPREGRVPVEVAVDAETFEPLALRAVCANCTDAPPLYKITMLVGIPRRDEDFAASTPPAKRHIEMFRSTFVDVAVSDTLRAMTATPVWLGGKFGSLALAGVQAVETAGYAGASERGRPVVEGTGLVFFYGHWDKHGRRYLARGDGVRIAVAESADPDLPFSGFNFRVDAGRVTGAAGIPIPQDGKALMSHVNDLWTAQMRRGPLYLEVEATDRTLVLDAAANLQDVPRPR